MEKKYKRKPFYPFQPDLTGQVDMFTLPKEEDETIRKRRADAGSRYLNEQREMTPERAALIAHHLMTPVKEFPKFIGAVVAIHLVVWLFSL